MANIDLLLDATLFSSMQRSEQRISNHSQFQKKGVLGAPEASDSCCCHERQRTNPESIFLLSLTRCVTVRPEDPNNLQSIFRVFSHEHISKSYSKASLNQPQF